MKVFNFLVASGLMVFAQASFAESKVASPSRTEVNKPGESNRGKTPVPSTRSEVGKAAEAARVESQEQHQRLEEATKAGGLKVFDGKKSAGRPDSQKALEETLDAVAIKKAFVGQASKLRPGTNMHVQLKLDELSKDKNVQLSLFTAEELSGKSEADIIAMTREVLEARFSTFMVKQQEDMAAGKISTVTPKELADKVVQFIKDVARETKNIQDPILRKGFITNALLYAQFNPGKGEILDSLLHSLKNGDDSVDGGVATLVHRYGSLVSSLVSQGKTLDAAAKQVMEQQLDLAWVAERLGISKKEAQEFLCNCTKKCAVGKSA